MKADESRAPQASKPKHQLAHGTPTVIHHPEEEMSLLERWLHRAMANPTRFWGLVAGVAVVTLGLSILGSGITLGGAAVNEAWTKLETAKNPGERVEIAREFPKTPAGRWALLQAATEYYNQGFNDLPSNREAALPNLKKALDLFEQVAREAPADSPQARAAALGLARTHEARNEIDEAIAQYDKVARTKAWAGTDEAVEAAKLAEALRSPEAVAFYKELYAFKPTQATLAPGAVGDIPLPLPPDHPPLNGPTTPTTTSPFTLPMPGALGTTPGGATEPNPLTVPPPPPAPTAPVVEEPKGPPPGGKPLDLLAPQPVPLAPAGPTPTPKPAGPAAAPGLPADVFAPK